jgi:hypothetical protein
MTTEDGVRRLAVLRSVLVMLIVLMMIAFAASASLMTGP